MGEDAIDKAVKRCKVKSGSPLEKLLRENAYQIYASGDSDTDKKLDAFLIEQSSNPLYADSLENGPPPPEAKPKLDLRFLTVEQFKAVAERGLTPEGTLK